MSKSELHSTYWAEKGLPKASLKKILKCFDDELSFYYPKNIPEMIDEQRYIVNTHQLPLIEFDNSTIFRFWDSGESMYCEIAYRNRFEVTITSFDKYKNLMAIQKYFRLYPFRIEIGEWVRFDKGVEFSRSNKDTGFPLLKAIDKLFDKYEMPVALLYWAGMVKNHDGVSNRHWKLKYDLYPVRHVFIIDSATGREISHDEEPLHY